MKKNILKSKTFWFNILTMAGAVTGTLPVTAVTAAVIGCINVGLRAITSQPVGLPTDPAVQ